MNQLKKLSLTIGAAILVIVSQAQNEVDALRYSLKETPMSARSLGMGGAFGAIGADISSFFHNPAGLGLYKRGGAEFSLGLNDHQSRSSYMGTSADNSRTRLTLNNLGLIGSENTGDSNWPTFNFGVAYGKTNNFFENYSIRGTSESSLLLPFSLQANGVLPEEMNDYFPFTAGLAYNSGVILPNDTLGTFYEPVGSGEVKQTKNITRTGAQGETAFGFGANYRDFIYFGMTINLMSIRFRERSSYSEEYTTNQFVNDFTFTEDLRSEGTGVSAKFGFLIKPSKWLRLGVAYHAPARYTLHETYITSLQANTAQGSGDKFESPQLITDYSIRTPSLMMANAAFVLGKMGVISADYEFTNFDRIKMFGSSTNEYDYASENSTISTIYRSTHKVRVGMEMRFLGTYYLRAGAIYQQNPFVNSAGAINNPFITYTGGIGYRNDYFFADFGLSYMTKETTYFMYDPRFVQQTNINSTNVNGLVSIGMRF